MGIKLRSNDTNVQFITLDFWFQLLKKKKKKESN